MKVLLGSSISNPPPLVVIEIDLDVLLKVVPVTWRVPPSKLSPPLGSPRLESPATEISPPRRMVPPE